MNSDSDSVTWTQVWVLSIIVVTFFVLKRFAQRITVLEGKAGVKQETGAS